MTGYSTKDCLSGRCLKGILCVLLMWFTGTLRSQDSPQNQIIEVSGTVISADEKISILKDKINHLAPIKPEEKLDNPGSNQTIEEYKKTVEGLKQEILNASWLLFFSTAQQEANQLLVITQKASDMVNGFIPYSRSYFFNPKEITATRLRDLSQPELEGVRALYIKKP